MPNSATALILVIVIVTVSWVYIDVVIAADVERLPPINTLPSVLDHRGYRGIKLANGLQALLISDSDVRKSTAALVVAVGSMNDEKEQPGIANLARYLLFSACCRNRKKRSFKEYLEEHGGTLRSELMTTEAEHKHHYAFEVNPDHFESTIKRFAKHFIEPLFEDVNDASLKEALGKLSRRHDRLMSTDTMRIAQVLKSMNEKDHEYKNLTYGTIQMLNKYAGVGREPLDEKLTNFVRKWYSADLMRLVVIHDESLDVLEEMVSTSFSAIKNTGVKKLTFSYEQHPWKSDQLGHKLCIVPAVDSMREIRLTFPTSDVLNQYKISPEKYAIQFINHRGAGTLGFVLPDRGLCKSKSVRAEYQTYAGIGFFTILMEPTEEGLKEVDRILELTFQYIHLLKNKGVEDWFYDEEKIIDESITSIINEKVNTSLNLASEMHDFPIEDIIIYKWWRGPWDAEPVHKFLWYLRPDNVNISVIHKSCESADADIETEPWYEIKYQIERIPEETIKKWALPTDSFPELKIPSRNEFIPGSSLPDDISDTSSSDELVLPPLIIHSSSISRIWYQYENEIPGGQIALHIMSPIMNVSPLSYLFMKIFLRILVSSQKEYEYSEERTGYSSYTSLTPVGFEIILAGPEVSKLVVLLQKVLFSLLHFEDLVTEENFEKCKTEAMSELRDRSVPKDPRQVGIFYLLHILANAVWTSAYEIRLLPLQKMVQRSGFEKFRIKLLSRIYIQGLIYAKCDEQKAKDIANIVEETFKQTFRNVVLPQEMLHLSGRRVRMKYGKNFVYYSYGQRPKHIYHAFFLLGSGKETSAEIRRQLSAELLSKIISEACSKILPPREAGTSECRYDSIGKFDGFVIMITSQMHPRHSDLRAERFLEIIRDKLRDITDEEVKSHRMSLLMDKTRQKNDPNERFIFHLHEIKKRTYAFEKYSTKVEKIGSIQKKDVIAFFEEILAKRSSKRRKIVVHEYSRTLIRNAPRDVTADDDEMDLENELQNTKIIEDILTFKNSLPLMPTPLPKMNFVFLSDE